MKHIKVTGYFAFVILLATVTILYRYHLFSQIAPWSDQLSTAAWGMLLANAKHFFPHASSGQSFYHALLTDNQSFLNQLFRRLYVDPIQMYVCVNLFFLFLFYKIFGVTYSVFVFTGIFFSGVTILLLGCYPLFTPATERKKSFYFTGAIAALLASTSFFQTLYSPLGKHNTGAFFLLLAIFVSMRLIKKLNTYPFLLSLKNWIVFYFFQLAAIFTTWLTIFILPAATVFTFLISGGKKRIKYCFVYSIIILAVACLTLLFTMFIQHGVADTTYSDIFDISHFGSISLFFIRACVAYYSLPGFICGIIGLYLLGRNHKEWMPFMLFVSFYLLPYLALNFTIIPDINNRFMPYILPIFDLGFAYFIICVWQKLINYKKVFSLSLGFLLFIIVAWHEFIQIPILINPNKVQYRVPDYYYTYLTRPGNIQAIVQQAIQQIPNKASIFTWDYTELDLLRVLGGKEFQAKNFITLPALSSLEIRKNDGSLPSYLAKTQITIPMDQPAYVFAKQDISEKQLTDNIRLLPINMSKQPNITLVLIKSYPTDYRFATLAPPNVSAEGGFNLYQVKFITD